MKRIRPSRVNSSGTKRTRPVTVRQNIGWIQRAHAYEQRLGMAELRKVGLLTKYVPSVYRTKIQQAIQYEEESIYKQLRMTYGPASALKT